MEKAWMASAFALGLAIAAPGLAQQAGPGAVDAPPVKMDVVAKDYTLTPDRVVVSRNQNIDLTLINEGAVEHNLVLKLPSAEVKYAEPVGPGGRRTLSFRAPEQAGTYEIYCPMGNHHERGMTASLVVR
jgi:uncharacterized cupredoxin-like copper-binding protein